MTSIPSCYAPAGGLPPIRAAAYVRMSTDHQEYSTRNQLDRIKEYADAHCISIVQVYEDAGKSGLTIEGRPALMKLMADVQLKPDFELLLVYDVSRWGRFQDIDESAYCEIHCRRNGVSVAYCAEDFREDGSIYAAIQKVVARAGAAKFSYDLSARVFDSQCRMVKMGFKPGGAAIFGLRRMLLGNDGAPVCVLQRGQQKAIQNQRVILVPGPEDEIEVVNRIFSWYVNDRLGDRRIAAMLNAGNIEHPDGRAWTADMIRHMLRNEKYIGNIVFNKASFKLRKTSVRNPPEIWVRCDNALAPIVAVGLFNAAQRERARRYRRYSRADLLNVLLRLYNKHGRLSTAIIDQDLDAPTASLIARHFGTLSAAYDAVGVTYSRNNAFVNTRSHAYALRANVQAEVEMFARRAGVSCERMPAGYCLRLNGNVVLAVRTLCCRRELRYGYLRWQGPTPAAVGADFILAAQLDPTNTHIAAYLLLAAADVPGNSFEFTPDGICRFKMRTSNLVDFFAPTLPAFIC